MIDTLAGPGTGEADALTASDLLSALRERRAAENRAAADQLDLAARWADLHPPESIHEAATWIGGGETGLLLAGPGAPMRYVRPSACALRYFRASWARAWLRRWPATISTVSTTIANTCWYATRRPWSS